MREVGVNGLLGAPGLRIPISAHCEKILLDVEFDLSNSVTTLEAVQWAICELQRMELQERYSLQGSYLDEGEADASDASLEGSAGKEQNGDLGGAVSETGPSRYEQRNEDRGEGTRNGIHSEQGKSQDEEPIKTSPDKKVSPRDPKQRETEKPAKIEVQNWKRLFQAPGKRKSDQEDPGSEAGKRSKSSESPESTFEADDAEGGKWMAKRISARLAVPECVVLTNLVSHCLLVSLDQVPPKRLLLRFDGEGTAAMPGHGISNGSKPSSAADQQGVGDSTSNDWLWLHRWLVKTCLSDAGDDDRFASLDWLIAFMTSACQSLIKPILDDLAFDLERRESEGSMCVVSYIRRAGVLEYAAFRWDL